MKIASKAYLIVFGGIHAALAYAATPLNVINDTGLFGSFRLDEPPPTAFMTLHPNSSVDPTFADSTAIEIDDAKSLKPFFKARARKPVSVVLHLTAGRIWAIEPRYSMYDKDFLKTIYALKAQNARCWAIGKTIELVIYGPDPDYMIRLTDAELEAQINVLPDLGFKCHPLGSDYRERDAPFE